MTQKPRGLDHGLHVWIATTRYFRLIVVYPDAAEASDRALESLIVSLGFNWVKGSGRLFASSRHDHGQMMLHEDSHQFEGRRYPLFGEDTDNLNSFTRSLNHASLLPR
jgi:hypothetical protein